MKLTTIILLSACLTASAAGLTQTVTLNFKKAPLEKVLTEIKKQTGYSIFYNYRLLDKAAPVTISVKNAGIDEVMKACLKDQALDYEIADRSIVIKEKAEKADLSPGSGHSGLDPESFPPIDITGRVTDADGNPLSGASVKVKGSSRGTTTNNDGVFTLKGVDDNAVLEISYVGYEILNIPVNNRTAIVTSLKQKPESLNEVVINKGYYTEKQKYSVGNVTKVTSKDLERQPVSNPLLALKGMVPGLLITQANGIPGGGVTVRIQGQNSIGAGSDPLYVIDGVPYPSQMLPTTSIGTLLGQSSAPNAYSSGGNGNPLSYLNTDDIESIEVLKDADATSIYGSRAANGAILITTKSGKAGPTKVDFNLEQGWGKVSRSLEMMNTQQYLQMRKEAFSNDNLLIKPTDANYDVNGLWDQTRYTDWKKILIGGTAKYTNLSGSVSGGNSAVQYLIGTNYHKETTVFPGDFSDQKDDVHFSINSTSVNRKFHIGLAGNYMVDNNHLPETDYAGLAYTLAPDAPPLYNADGTLNWAPNLSGNASWDNPLAQQYKIYQNKTDNLVSSANLNYSLLSGLELSSRFGFTKLSTDEFSTELTSSQKPEKRANYQRSASYSNSNIQIFNVEPQLNYKKTVGNGTLDFLIGSTIQQQKSNGQVLAAGGFATDGVRDLSSATIIIPVSSVDATYKYNAGFGRLNYSWKNKYIVNLTGRRDGSSRFGPENRFHNFASAGGAWIFTEEGFIQRTLKFLSFGKLKVSYGTSGNDQIGDYSFLERYVSNNPAVPYQGGSSIRINRITNPYLEWEETRKLSAGLELNFFNDRLAISVIYGQNRSSNQLLSYKLPIITGFASIDRNFPATVENTTWEIFIKSSNIKTKVFEWTSSFNITIPRNKLIAFPGLENSSYKNVLVVGQPLSINKVFLFSGVDPLTGLYQFEGSGGLTASPDILKDPYILVNTDPKFYGGLQNTIQYKRFEIDALFQFINQTQKDAYQFGMGTNPPGYSIFNQPVSVLNRWQKPGDIETVQRYGKTSSIVYGPYSNAANYSDASYVNASYIRLQNLSLSYNLNSKLIQSLRIKQCSIFVHGQNLFAISTFRGVDPANRSYNSLTPLKVYTVGLHVGL